MGDLLNAHPSFTSRAQDCRPSFSSLHDSQTPSPPTRLVRQTLGGEFEFHRRICCVAANNPQERRTKGRECAVSASPARARRKPGENYPFRGGVRGVVPSKQSYTVDMSPQPREQHGRRMSYSVQQCVDRARECEWRASQAKDSVAKGEFIELARQWQELAREKKEMERDRRKSP
jgi:hypothetical protein